MERKLKQRPEKTLLDDDCEFTVCGVKRSKMVELWKVSLKAQGATSYPRNWYQNRENFNSKVLYIK